MTEDQLTELLDVDVETYAEMTAEMWRESDEIGDGYPVTFHYRGWYCRVYLRLGDTGAIDWDAACQFGDRVAIVTMRRTEIYAPPATALDAIREAIAAIDESHGGGA